MPPNTATAPPFSGYAEGACACFAKVCFQADSLGDPFCLDTQTPHLCQEVSPLCQQKDNSCSRKTGFFSAGAVPKASQFALQEGKTLPALRLLITHRPPREALETFQQAQSTPTERYRFEMGLNGFPVTLASLPPSSGWVSADIPCTANSCRATQSGVAGSFQGGSARDAAPAAA